MFVYFNLLNSNESLFYTLLIVITKMIQRTNNNHNKSLK